MAWLEEHLAAYKKTVILVSHDRLFLDRVTNKTLEIEHTTSRLYKCSYSQYVVEKEAYRREMEKKYNLQQKEIARLEAYIAQQRAWNRERNIIAAESREKAIARMEKVEKPKALPKAISFKLQSIPYTFLLAMCIAVIDALPILGVGTVLIPWSIISLVTGDFFHAVGMIATYGVVLVIRNMVEPKIVGMHIGLHPFVSLLCIYFGYRIAGFGGMFLVPVLVLLICKLQELGVIKVYNE